ncbi:alpha-L-fucosidase [Candidatus Enterococcus willemsii]|uniref:alpha-L-fucosidase n=1 Tax=Candidatus Enterococcus willemsii TaxID=1857215 RepID=A0ABQ6Z0T8_9ENTE|nr:alpha-L-fucosidase [Enterococcus sp. CU12B]KAF1304622.1 alpha-L-fucosidase [Enterococcus sp. CU12B]
MKKIRNDIEENLTTQQEEYQHLPQVIQEKLEWFQDQKIGIIFHWGLYAEAGIVESWQLSEEDDWARKKGAWREDIDTLRHDYWALNKQFNPVNFNPTIWAEKAKEAGFKYSLFTTKHHDGFNMYDTKYSEYKITSPETKFHNHPHADVLKYINQAFQEVGIHTGLYYSKADWYAKDYWVPGQRPRGRYASYDPREQPETWKSYNQFVENQLVELCENYGPVDILWLDGGWVNSANNEFLDMDTIAEKLRAIQSDLLIVDRTIGGDYENYVTPERKIPEIPPKKAWESNIPLAKNWGYVPNDQYKSFDEIIQALVQVVALGGNIILGVGPKPDGTLPEEALAIMSQLGDWLKRYGQGIYETRPYPLSHDNWFFTQTTEAIYAFHKNGTAFELDTSIFPETIATITNLTTDEELTGSTLHFNAHSEPFTVIKLTKGASL